MGISRADAGGGYCLAGGETRSAATRFLRGGVAQTGTAKRLR